MKLKSLLEGYAWERKPGKGLPTLSEVEAQHRKNLTEEDDLTKQSLSALSAVCEKYKSDLEAGFNQAEIDNADAKNVIQNNAMLLMTAICKYISDIQSLHETYPDYSLDDIVIENAKQILSTDVLEELDY